MSITSYAALKAAVQTWNPHSDVPSVVDDLLDLAEARLSRELRCRRMVATQTGTITSGDSTLSVPTDLLEVVELRVGSGTSGRTLEKRPLVDFEARYLSQTSGTTEAFAIDGGTFRFGPATASDLAYTLRYYQRIPALSSSNTSNWLLEDAPDLYLWACLVEAERFLRNPEGVSYMEAQYQQARDSLVSSDRRARWMGGTQRIMAL